MAEQSIQVPEFSCSGLTCYSSANASGLLCHFDSVQRDGYEDCLKNGGSVGAYEDNLRACEAL